MTQDPRIDRLEGIMERVVAELSEIRQDLRSMQSATDSKFRTLILINVGLWATTVASIIGLFFKNG